MKTSVEKISDVKVRLTISLNQEDLADAKKVALTKIAKDIKISGFRKGKAPLEAVEKNADPIALGQEAMENAISKAVAEAFLKEEIQALHRPEVEVKKFVPDQEMEFTAEAEIFPEIKLADYKNLKVKKDKVSVSKEEIQDVLEKVQSGFAKSEKVDREAKNGDEVIIDFLGKKDGVAFDGGKAEKFPLELGSKSFIPGFEDGIIGKKVGEKFDLNLEFPKDYHAKNLAGEKVVFEVVLHEVKEKKLPELNDEFAKQVGEFKTLEDFKTQIEKDLIERKEYEIIEKFKDNLVKELAEKSNIPLPEVMVEDQKKAIEFDMQQNLAYSGLSLEQYLEKMGKTKDEWLESDVKNAAEFRVKAGLVLAELSKVEGLDVSDEEFNARFEQIKTQYSKNKEVMKQLSTPEMKNNISNQILTEKAVNLLVDLNSK